jgi:cell wall-associated NlpC family hydrolase
MIKKSIFLFLVFIQTGVFAIDSVIVQYDSISPNKSISQKEDASISAIIGDYISSTTSNILSSAKEFIGTPYKFGGSNRSGIDCSGFIQAIFQPNGISLPRMSREQASKGIKVEKENIKKGDLLFFNTRGGISHVGVVSEITDGVIRFIHASSSKGVIESSLKETYWASRFITARRIIDIFFPS